MYEFEADSHTQRSFQEIITTSENIATTVITILEDPYSVMQTDLLNNRPFLRKVTLTNLTSKYRREYNGLVKFTRKLFV